MVHGVSKTKSEKSPSEKSWVSKIQDRMGGSIVCMVAAGTGVYGILVMCRDLRAPKPATTDMNECLANDSEFFIRQLLYPLTLREEFGARRWETCFYMGKFMYRNSLEALLRNLWPMMGHYEPLTVSTRPNSVRSQYAVLLQHGTLDVIPGPVHDRQLAMAMCTFSLDLNQVILTAQNAGRCMHTKGQTECSGLKILLCTMFGGSIFTYIIYNGFHHNIK